MVEDGSQSADASAAEVVTMTLVGLGIWSCFELASHDDLDSVGACWVAPRGGEGGARGLNEAGRDAHWSGAVARSYIAEAHSRARRVLPWFFSRPVSWSAEVDLVARLLDDGADGVIIDAESSWEVGAPGGHRSEARAMMDELRRRFPNALLLDAPWPWEGFHPNFPILDFSGGADGGASVDAHLPQAYWTEIGSPVARTLTLMEAQWSAIYRSWGPKAKRLPIYPIGVTYGRAQLLAAGHPRTTARLDVTPEDVAFFLDHHDSNDPISLYQADRWCRSPAVWAMLQERARGATVPPSTLRQPADVADGSVTIAAEQLEDERRDAEVQAAIADSRPPTIPSTPRSRQSSQRLRALDAPIVDPSDEGKPKR